MTASNDRRSISPLQKHIKRKTNNCAKIDFSPSFGSRSEVTFNELDICKIVYDSYFVHYYLDRNVSKPVFGRFRQSEIQTSMLSYKD